MSLLRIAADALAVAGALALGALVLPPACEAVALAWHRDDATAVTNYRLATLSPVDFAQAAERALVEDDPERASSIDELALSLGKSLPPDLRSRISDAAAIDVSRIARDLWRGAADSDATSPAGLAGALVADVSGIGDVRDLLHEGSAYLNNESYDAVTLGLAGIGLTLTVATVASLGAATPARVGATILKAGNKAGRLSPPLRGELLRLAREAIDGDALRATLALAKRGDIGGTRVALGRVLRPAPVATLKTAASDLGTVAKAHGYRATTDLLQLSRSSTDMRKLTLLSGHYGPRFRGVLAVLGAATLTFAGLTATIVAWLLGAAMWALGVAYLAYRLLRRLLR